MIESSDQAGLHSEAYISAIIYPSYKSDTLTSLLCSIIWNQITGPAHTL